MLLAQLFGEEVLPVLEVRLGEGVLEDLDEDLDEELLVD